MDFDYFKNILNNNNNQFLLIAGPCAIESEQMAMKIAEKIKSLTEKHSIPYIFKGSFKKANRTRSDSFTGIGDKKALNILGDIRKKLNIPTLTDIHQVNDAQIVSEYVDVLQIPAFLARQTDLIEAAGSTGKVVNIKKGQFMSAESMKFAVDKVLNSGNNNAWITERGSQFGYQDLIVDFRGIPIMKEYAPTILDVTHSLQKPNQSNGISGGNPQGIENIAKAAIATGVDGIFLETHFDPKNAKSDGANMLDIKYLEGLLFRLAGLRDYYTKNLK